MAFGDLRATPYYSLLIVALLERGGPITLEEAAKRFEEAGVAPAARLVDELGLVISKDDVQLARIADEDRRTT